MPEFFKHPIMKFVVYPVIGLALIHRLGLTVIDPANYIPALGGMEDTISYPEDLIGGFSMPSMSSLPSLPSFSSLPSTESSGSSAVPLPPVPASSGAVQAVPAVQNQSRSDGSCGDHGSRPHAQGTYSNGMYTIAWGDTHYSVQFRFPCASIPSPRGMIAGTTIPVK